MTTYLFRLFSVLVSASFMSSAAALEVPAEYQQCVERLISEELGLNSSTQNLSIVSESIGFKKCLFHNCHTLTFNLKNHRNLKYVGYAEVAVETKEDQKYYCRFYSHIPIGQAHLFNEKRQSNKNLVIIPAGSRQRPILDLADGAHNDLRIEM